MLLEHRKVNNNKRLQKTTEYYKRVREYRKEEVR